MDRARRTVAEACAKSWNAKWWENGTPKRDDKTGLYIFQWVDQIEVDCFEKAASESANLVK
jgi:hypothetical protein